MSEELMAVKEVYKAFKNGSGSKAEYEAALDRLNGPRKDEEKEQKKTQLEEKNYSEINDDFHGIYFKIGKNFDRIEEDKLKIKNSNYLYGFFAKNDPKVNCWIWREEKKDDSLMTLAELRNQAIEKVKNNYPAVEVNLKNSFIVEIGDNNKGAKLELSLTDTDDTPIFLWEKAGITDKRFIASFCIFPIAVVELYQDDINLFLDSLRIK